MFEYGMADACQPGRETEPAGEVTGVAVVADFATGGRNHGGGGQQTDAGHGEQFLAGGLFNCHAQSTTRVKDALNKSAIDR